MSTVDNALELTERLNEAVKRLYRCTTKEQISKIFTEYQIVVPEDKRDLLHRCMDIEGYFSFPHEKLSAKDEYEYVVSVFLQGSWRLMANE